jgi:hypothetical protein
MPNGTAEQFSFPTKDSITFKVTDFPFAPFPTKRKNAHPEVHGKPEAKNLRYARYEKPRINAARAKRQAAFEQEALSAKR